MSLDPIVPGSDVFTEDDLAPSDEEKRAVRNSRIDKAAATVAAIALGVWLGGTVALGACAAPMVFEMTPYPLSGKAMGAAFMRFDMIAIGCAVLALAAEITRTLLTLKRRSKKGAIAARIRRYLLIFFGAAVVYTGTQISPAIMELHEGGVRRNVGAAGAELERIHAQAETVGKINAVLALVLIVLHVSTVRSPYDELEDDEDDAYAPLPPGPAPKD